MFLKKTEPTKLAIYGEVKEPILAAPVEDPIPMLLKRKINDKGQVLTLAMLIIKATTATIVIVIIITIIIIIIIIKVKVERCVGSSVYVSFLVTPKRNTTMCNNTSCAQVHELL